MLSFSHDCISTRLFPSSFSLACTHRQVTHHCPHPWLPTQSHRVLLSDAWAHNQNLLWDAYTPGVDLAQRDVQSLSDVFNRFVALWDDAHTFSNGLGCDGVVPSHHNHLTTDRRSHTSQIFITCKHLCVINCMQFVICNKNNIFTFEVYIHVNKAQISFFYMLLSFLYLFIYFCFSTF